MSQQKCLRGCSDRRVAPKNGVEYLGIKMRSPIDLDVSETFSIVEPCMRMSLYDWVNEQETRVISTDAVNASPYQLDKGKQ